VILKLEGLLKMTQIAALNLNKGMSPMSPLPNNVMNIACRQTLFLPNLLMVMVSTKRLIRYFSLFKFLNETFMLKTTLGLVVSS